MASATTPTLMFPGEGLPDEFRQKLLLERLSATPEDQEEYSIIRRVVDDLRSQTQRALERRIPAAPDNQDPLPYEVDLPQSDRLSSLLMAEALGGRHEAYARTINSLFGHLGLPEDVMEEPEMKESLKRMWDDFPQFRELTLRRNIRKARMARSSSGASASASAADV